MKKLLIFASLMLGLSACDSTDKTVKPEGVITPEDSVLQHKNDSIKAIQLERIKREKLRNNYEPK